MTTGEHQLALLSDDPTSTDLLSFDAVAKTVADAVLDTRLDPVAIGMSGSWGSGKTTVLRLIEAELVAASTDDQKICLVSTDPWRYDPATGAKESLIAEVLAALGEEVAESATPTDKAKDLLKRLTKRVDWAKAIKLASTSAVTLQLPSWEKLMDLVKPKDAEDEIRGLEAFREEFAQLIKSDDLKHVRAVVVLVDDLDRCLPETVVETLEAIRLFLAVPRMSFVIAADEERVADAIRSRLNPTSAPDSAARDGEEDPAKLYLHKIVQTVVPLPALSHFDVQTYLLLLQLLDHAESADVAAVIEQCVRVRGAGGTVDDLKLPKELEVTEEMAFASRLTPLLYERLHGNPRRIKRFVNDLRVRQSVASRRGIDLNAPTVAKLMTLEALMYDDFKVLLGWFGQGQLRDRLSQLEAAAGRPASSDDIPAAAEQPAKGKGAASDAKPPTDEFSDALIRWAKMPPAIGSRDLSPYLTLAAAFAGVTLIDEALPQRLRDLAANLLSDSRQDQSSVSDADLQGLAPGDGRILLLHCGRAMRDQPQRQKAAVNAILRISRLHGTLAPVGAEALLMLPPSELSLATPLQFRGTDAQPIHDVLGTWRSQVDTTAHAQVAASLDNAMAQKANA